MCQQRALCGKVVPVPCFGLSSLLLLLTLRHRATVRALPLRAASAFWFGMRVSRPACVCTHCAATDVLVLTAGLPRFPPLQLASVRCPSASPSTWRGYTDMVYDFQPLYLS